MQPQTAKKVKKAIALFEEKRFPQSAALLQEALAEAPPSPPALRYMGLLHAVRGDAKNAFSHLQAALNLSPEDTNILHDLGSLLDTLGEITAAAGYFLRASQLQPQNTTYLQSLAHCVRPMRFNAPNPALFEALSRAMAAPDMDGSSFMQAWLSLYKLSPGFARLQNAVADEADIAALPEDTLLQQALSQHILCDAAMEEWLAALRRKLALTPDAPALPAARQWLAALGLQAFLNEYIWPENADERQRIAALREKAASGTTETGELLLLGCYQPIYKVDGIEASAALLDKNGLLQRFWQKQVAEPLREAAIKAEIARSTTITPGLSEIVQAQYEANPYPRWDRLDRFPAKTFSAYMAGLFPRADAALWSRLPAKPSVLVAGVGTGRQVLSTAALFREHRYTAVDLSAASLAYAIRRQQELLPGSAIRFSQADILRLEEAFPPESFDMIECGGVLHHMADPMAGWRVLTRLLKPRGLMKIALYSKAARGPIANIRTALACDGLPSTPEEIRVQRQRIVQMAAEDPTYAFLLDSPDFYSLSACRDLLFHVHEHTFTLPQIADCIATLGLGFIGMDLQDSRATALFRTMFPETLENPPTLAQWHDFEQANPGAFGGMYQFWLHKPLA